MSPTPRAALVLALIAPAALFLPLWLVALAIVALLAATAADALTARRPPAIRRDAASVLYLGIPSPLRLSLVRPVAGAIRLRQPVPPDLALSPSEADGELEAELRARRRGRHELPAPAARVQGPLGLGAWLHRPGEAAEVLVYPDIPRATALANAVRRGLFRETGLHRRGPLGLGTEFESVRDYLPDDDVRRINWRATARLGRPMSNEYRIEQDRDVICLVDAGRLMAAPLGEKTRLDIALDAVVAVAAVTEAVGDRCGALAFDEEVRRQVQPRHKGARHVVQAFFDLEPRAVESDYERAFHLTRELKRAAVFVFTDLLEEAAARQLLAAVPVLRNRHFVAIASVIDPDIDALTTTPPGRPVDVYRAAVALDVLAARARVAALLRRQGAEVIEATASALPAACVRSYLRTKARARL